MPIQNNKDKPAFEQSDKDYSKFFHVIIDSRIWAELSFKAKAVLMVLHRYADYTHRIASPSTERIAKEAGISRDGVTEARKELMTKGLISIRRGGPRINFRYIHTVHKEPRLDLVGLTKCITRKKPGKCTNNRDSKGKFMSNLKKTDEYLREKTSESSSREKTAVKEILEIGKGIRDTAGSASACPNSQAEPVSNVLKCYIGQTINLNTLKFLLSLDHSRSETIDLIRSVRIGLEKGVDLDEVIKSAQIDKGKMP